MKVTISNDEVKSLANMIVQNGQLSTVPAEFTDDWMVWVAIPIAQHAITPREAKAILTVAGILTDYGVSIDEIIEKTLETFVINYQKDSLRRQNYSCNTCGLKSFVTYSSKEDVFDIATKIKNDHEKREPTCPCPVDNLNVVGDPIKI